MPYFYNDDPGQLPSRVSGLALAHAIFSLSWTFLVWYVAPGEGSNILVLLDY